MNASALDALQQVRAAEKEQALFYRTLAAEAEAAGDDALAERLQELHADEQHHFSRLTARLLECGAAAPELSQAPPAGTTLDGWEEVAGRRERDEVARYEAMLAGGVDAATAALLEGILEVERHHARELGGKWTMA